MGLEQRITALEKRMGISAVLPRRILIFLKQNETDEEALARAGVDPADPNVLAILIQSVAPSPVYE